MTDPTVQSRAVIFMGENANGAVWSLVPDNAQSSNNSRKD